MKSALPELAPLCCSMLSSQQEMIMAMLCSVLLPCGGVMVDNQEIEHSFQVPSESSVTPNVSFGVCVSLKFEKIGYSHSFVIRCLCTVNSKGELSVLLSCRLADLVTQIEILLCQQNDKFNGRSVIPST